MGVDVVVAGLVGVKVTLVTSYGQYVTHNMHGEIRTR